MHFKLKKLYFGNIHFVCYTEIGLQLYFCLQKKFQTLKHLKIEIFLRSLETSQLSVFKLLTGTTVDQIPFNAFIN